MQIERPYKSLLINRLENEPRRFIQVMYGPRQVGKSTIALQISKILKAPTHFVSADAVTTNQDAWIANQWETVRVLLARSEAKEAVLFIDEIQKIPNWSEQIKKEWDDDSKNEIPIKVVLLGSSRLMIQQGLTESLAGRFETTYIGHWSFEEMKSGFGFTHEQYVWFGGYPGAADLIEDEDRWKNYISNSLIETTISKDILMLTRVDKPALMKQMFEIGCNYSGQILSLTKLLGQLHDAGNTTTLSHYLELLNTAALIQGIPKFSPDTMRQRAASPKLQVFNNALLTAQQALSFEECIRQPEKWGRWVESAIGAHLLNHSMEHKYQVYYWRERNEEVDFVISRGDQAIGIEVKTGSQKVKSGFSSFKKKYHPLRMIATGKEGIPWQEFLSIPPKELFNTFS